MANYTDKFFELIGYSNPIVQRKLRLEDIILVPENDTLNVVFKADFPLQPKQMLEFVTVIEAAIIKNISKINYKFVFDDPSKENPIEYLKVAIMLLSKKNQELIKAVDFNVTYSEETSTIHVIIPNNETALLSTKDEISDLLSNIGYPDVDLFFELSDRGNVGSEKIKEAQKELYDKILKSEAARSIYVKYDTHKELSGEIVSLSELPDTEEEFNDFMSQKQSDRKKVNFLINGTIEFVDAARLEAGTAKFVVYDGENYVYCSKRLVNNDYDKEYFSQLVPGLTAHVQCYPSFDDYSQCVVMRVTNMEFSKNPRPITEREDNANVKRVELDVHTKMSSMDGVSSVIDYVKAAKIFGHKAIALTDFSSLQSFHDMQVEAGKNDIKALYGVELNYVDQDEVIPAYAPKDINFDDATFVVYDLEVTGISAHYEKIIEVSAVKIRNKEIIDSFSELVDPEKKIPTKVVELTGIHQIDVDGKRTRDEVIPDFHEFIKGCVLVAHNASYDVTHLYNNFKDLKIEHEDFPVIDTLVLSKILFPGHKRYGLDAMCKLLDVNLAHHHRALDDATATGYVFIHLLNELEKKDIHNHKDINSLVDLSLSYKYPIPSRITLLVKNHNGFVNLNRIYSDAATTYVASEPVVTKTTIEKYHEGILVSGGNRNSDLFDIAFNGTDEHLEKVIQFYDYVTVQPIESFMHFQFSMGSYEYCVVDTIKRIITLARKYNIPVCATGNCFQVNREDTLYRKIMVDTVGSKTGGIVKRNLLCEEEDIPDDFYRTTEEMLDGFAFLGKEKAYEIVVTNTNLIADMCDSVQPFNKTQYAPKDDFMAKIGIPSAKEYLNQTSLEKAYSLYGELLPGLVLDRMNQEKDSIIPNNYATIYLVSSLLVNKSTEDGYVVGSRGSVGSSFIAFLMGITEVNSLPPHYRCPKCHYSAFKMTPAEKEKYGIRPDEENFQAILDEIDSGFDLPDAKCPICGSDLIGDGHNIPFETFLGFPGKPKTPDIDLNFSSENQGIIHNYIRELFGEERAFRAGTILTISDKTTYAIVSDYFQDMDRKHGSITPHRKAEIEALSMRISEIKKSSSQHPGGIVVVPADHEIYEVTPIQYPGDSTDKSWKTTHFEYHTFEDNLFKLDALGQDDPTVMKYLMTLVHAHQSEFPFDNPADIQIKDQKIYRLMSETEVINVTPSDIKSKVASYGISEFGTDFVRDLLENTRPKNFGELIKVSGLSHGTNLWKGNAQDLIEGKTKEFSTKIPFKKVIGCRDDIMINLINVGVPSDIAFQIMEFCRKGKALVDKQKWRGFVEILEKYKMPAWYIWSCSKIKYLFPKAHAVAYVISALRIAWFKVYKPLYFYSALFSKKLDTFDIDTMVGGSIAIKDELDNLLSLSKFEAKAKQQNLITTFQLALEMCVRGFKFYTVNLYKSQVHDFALSEDGTGLYLPFCAIDSLGDACGQSIIDARNEKPFSTQDDFMKRTKTSKTIFERMKSLGMFEGIPENNQISWDF